MARLNMDDLPPADKATTSALRRMVTPKGARFEKPKEAAAEDKLRLKRARKLVAGSTTEQRRVERLIRRLERGTATRRNPKTMASSRRMRRVRQRFAAAVMQLARGYEKDLRFFTLIPRGWMLTPAELVQFDPVKRLKAVRADLYRAEAKGVDGWVLMVIHGEFNPGNKRFQLHLHGVAYGAMVAVVDRLRKQRAYKSTKKCNKADRDGVSRRVRLDRGPAVNVLAAVTYLVQAFWPSRYNPNVTVTFDEVADGLFPTSPAKRVRDKQRIPEPYHTQALLWLDRYSLADISLNMGVHVTAAGLTLSKH